MLKDLKTAYDVVARRVCLGVCLDGLMGESLFRLPFGGNCRSARLQANIGSTR